MAAAQLNLVCSFHPHTDLNLFCCKCEDIICFKCLLENHQTHELKAVSDIPEVIESLLNQYLTTRKEEVESKITEIKESLLEEVTDCEENCAGIIDEIEKCSNERKAEIEKSTNDLIATVKIKNKSYKDSLQTIIERLTLTESKICEVSTAKKKDYVTEDEWGNQVKLFTDIKQSMGALNHIKSQKELLKPRFEVSDSSDTSLGNIVTGKQKLPGLQAQCLQYASVCTQTVQDEKPNEQTIQTDEYPVTIEFLSSQKPPTKIVPVSEKNGWAICDNKLFELKGSVLEKSLYTENIDDIAILKDKSLLLLDRQRSYIKRLLNGFSANFFSVGSSISKGLFVSSDEKVIVFSNKFSNKCQDRLISYSDIHGIAQSMFDFKLDSHCVVSQLTVSKNNSHLYFLCHDTGWAVPRSRCVQVDMQTKDTKEFQGAIGLSPYDNFHCYGICLDPNNKLLVSDKQHHSIFLVDENMKYVKTVFTADDGLRSPTAISLYNGILWVVDGTKLHKLRYCV